MEKGDVVGGRFEIDRLAGHGGMAAVYRATDRETGAPAAVKILFDRDAPAVSRFAREAALLADLAHPSIVRYLAHEASPGRAAWLAMEWVDGESLEQLFERRSLEPDEGVLVVRQAAEALGIAHAKGVVHRDVEPSNLMLAGGDVGRIKLLDFGVARGGRDALVTATGAVVGTAF